MAFSPGNHETTQPGHGQSNFDSGEVVDVDSTIAAAFKRPDSAVKQTEVESPRNMLDDTITKVTINKDMEERERDSESGSTNSLIAVEDASKEDDDQGGLRTISSSNKLLEDSNIETMSTIAVDFTSVAGTFDTLETKSLASELPRNVGFWGGVCLLINNLAGPTLTLMPGMCQDAGWLSLVLFSTVFAVVAALCGFMVIEAIRAIPGNATFKLEIELGELTRFYFRGWIFWFFIVSFIMLLVLNVMSYVIQTAVVLDFAFAGFGSCAYALEFSPNFGFVCATDLLSSTPFGESYVFPLSFLILGAVCAPLSCFSLGNSVPSQIAAIVGLTVLASYWSYFLGQSPDFPQPVPIATPNSSSLVGTLVFNFALIPSLPSWIRESSQGVKIERSIGIALLYVVVVYSAIGILGAAAFKDQLSETSETLFSKLNASGDTVARASLIGYPILQNITSIPITCIFIKYNLMQSFKLSNRRASLLSFFFPWLLSIPFYTGSNFEYMSSIGGGIFSFVINFLLPVVLFFRTPWVIGYLHSLKVKARLSKL